MLKKEDLDLIIEIAERAEDMKLLMFDRMSFVMDLEIANEAFNLRLEDLLNADNLNFAHDVCGIQNNINRETMKMENCFLPRFSGR